MKYFLDTEFIEGFHKPRFGKRRHFIDLISIGIVREDGLSYHAISSEYEYDKANDWVKENVIKPMYIQFVHGDARNRLNVTNFHQAIGSPLSAIRDQVLDCFGCWKDTLFWRAPVIAPEVYGYYADYDWVVFCSLFGSMIDLPKGFPMYCRDLKQMYDDKAESFTSMELSQLAYPNVTHNVLDQIDKGNPSVTKIGSLKLAKGYPKQEKEHNALEDARWNKKLYEFLQTV